jgi:hypothetical protein
MLVPGKDEEQIGSKNHKQVDKEAWQETVRQLLASCPDECDLQEKKAFVVE